MKRLAIVLALLGASSCVFKNEPPNFEDDACQEYCDQMDELCPDITFTGEISSFRDEGGKFDRTLCLATCETYRSIPVPDPDKAGEFIPLGDRVANRDSLECRLYHVVNAFPNQNTNHCLHAGPDGGGVCEDNALCNAYCPDLGELCGGTEFDPGNTVTCYEECASLKPGNNGETSGDTRSCRMHYLTLGLMDPQSLDASQCASAGLNATENCVD